MFISFNHARFSDKLIIANQMLVMIIIISLLVKILKRLIMSLVANFL